MYLFFDTETAREKTKLILDMAKIAKCPDSYGQKKIQNNKRMNMEKEMTP